MKGAKISRIRGLAWLAAPVAILAVVAACEDERSSVFEPFGVVAYDFNVALTPLGLPSGTAAVGATSVTLTASGLPALSGGVYQLWVVDTTSGTFLPVATKAFAGSVMEFYLRDSLAAGTTGAPVEDPITGAPFQVLDTTIVVDSSAAATRVATYAGNSGDSVTAVEIGIDSVDGGANPALQHAVVLTIEAAETSTPSDVKFLWRRIATGGGGALSFGNFGGVDLISTVSPADYVFVPVGVGRGGFRGPELAVDVQGLSRPPIGFYYVGWLIAENDNITLLDTLRSSWDFIEDVSRVSLFDADVNDLLPGVVTQAIDRAQLRNCASDATASDLGVQGLATCPNTLPVVAADAFPFKDFVTVALSLAPKGLSSGTRVSTLRGVVSSVGGIVLTGTVPEPARK